MDFFVFDENLKIGNKVLDQEHAILIEFINLLEDSVRNNASEQMLQQVLDGLIDYTKTHFYMEEELMRAYDYPLRKEHLRAHQVFREKIDAMNAAFQRGDKDISGAVTDFLKDWLTNHILKVDKQLAGHLRDKQM